MNIQTPASAVPSVNIRSDRYWIFAAPCRCLKCGAATKYYGYWVPEDHEAEQVYHYADDGEPDIEWCTTGADLRLTYIRYVLPEAFAEMAKLTSTYALDIEPDNENPYNSRPGKPYYTNHCHVCQQVITDEEMTHEVGQVAERLEFWQIEQPFAAHAGSHVSEGLFNQPPGRAW